MSQESACKIGVFDMIRCLLTYMNNETKWPYTIFPVSNWINASVFYKMPDDAFFVIGYVDLYISTRAN